MTPAVRSDQHSAPRLRRRELLRQMVATLAALAGETRLVAQESSRSNPDLNAAKLMTAETIDRVNLAQKWLASRQGPDGAFGLDRGFGRNVGVVALAGIAWLSSGSLPGRGPFGVALQKTLAYLLNCSRSNGFINAPESQSHGPMYEHGFATMFLAEVYGTTQQADLREKLDKAVRLIIACQNSEGGWRYENVPKEADISVTVCQIMALRAARNCGLFVPKETVDRCIDYVKRCQNDDGGFRYQLIQRSRSEFARSAAGLVALYSSGVYDGPEIESALRYLERHRPGGYVDQHFYYGHYYAVQAMYQAGGDHWLDWYPRIRDQLLREQLRDGSWIDAAFSNEYATAMASIILQLPNGHLPIFRR